MEIVDRNLLLHCARSLATVQETLERTACSTLVESRPRPGKADSLALDVIPEQILKVELLERYDRSIVLVTEERGHFNFEEIEHAEVVAFADPTDRSEHLERYLEEGVTRHGLDGGATFGELLRLDPEARLWTEVVGAEAPPCLTGPCCAMTLVKRGEILFTVALNYVTRELLVGSSEELVTTGLEDPLGEGGRPLRFPAPTDLTSYVTYLGGHYATHLAASGLLDDAHAPVEREPGGPLRILYLSDRNPSPAGILLSNGEKIGEWLGWLAFCRYSPDLVAYAVYPGTVFARDDVLTTPSPPYSVLEASQSRLRLNLTKLRYLENPSRYREMILVCHKDNSVVRPMIETGRARRIFGP